MEPASDPAARSIETAWLAQSVRLTLREVRSFARAFVGITFRPARFASAWVRGEAAAMNPLGYFAMSAAVMAVCTKVTSALLGWRRSDGLAIDLLDAIGPYLHYVALGLLCHALLLAAGSRRTVRGSLALSLYVGGGPLALVTLINLVVVVCAYLAFGKVNFDASEILTPAVLPLVVIAMGSRLAVVILFARALAGFHGVRTGWALVALVVALLVTGLAFGLLNPPGNYGGHFVIGAEQSGGERMWWPAYGL